MFDIGFLELLICGVIALLILGPERLPTAARAAGRWVGKSRRMVSQFTTELDRQLKADELRDQLRQAGDIGLEDVEQNVRNALDEARKYEHLVLPDDQASKPAPAPATRNPVATREARVDDSTHADTQDSAPEGHSGKPQPADNHKPSPAPASEGQPDTDRGSSPETRS